MTKLLVYGCWLALAACSVTHTLAAGAGSGVVVVYNKNLPESKRLAEYYAEKRNVPARQLLGVDVSATAEAMTRAEFRDRLQEPIFKWLTKQELITVNPRKRLPTDAEYHPVIDARVRYLVLCYGIPWKITRDPTLKEAGMDRIQEALRGRNEAAVDADLALVTATGQNIPLTGPLVNPFYMGTNAPALNAPNGLLMVTRLDGPTVEIARGLVDKALQAETNGFWGHAYIDSRGLTNGEYKMGDDWMRAAAEITRRTGFDTLFDERDTTFDAGFPASQIAVYAGWYDANVSGPFTRPTVEFMPGAFAYHIHSFSGSLLRSTVRNWVGPLLAKGATITMGSVEEPYLPGTPNVAVFLERLLMRHWTFGESAYACQASLSWQTTVVGDPLYRPMGSSPEFLHYRLEREKNPLLEWSHLRVINLNLATGAGVDAVTNYLASIAATAAKSAVLQEKLGNLLLAKNDAAGACDAYARALQLQPTPMHRTRLLLALGEWQTQLHREPLALASYQQLLAAAPDYPDAARIYREMARLAEALGRKSEAEKFAAEAQRAGAAPK